MFSFCSHFSSFQSALGQVCLQPKLPFWEPSRGALSLTQGGSRRNQPTQNAAFCLLEWVLRGPPWVHEETQRKIIKRVFGPPLLDRPLVLHVFAFFVFPCLIICFPFPLSQCSFFCIFVLIGFGHCQHFQNFKNSSKKTSKL